MSPIRTGRIVWLLLVFPSFVNAANAQGVEVTWALREPLGADDRRAILELAARLRIRNPKIAGDVVLTPCRTISVVSHSEVQGYRVTTESVVVHERTGAGCRPPVRPGFVAHESGNWVAYESAWNPGHSDLFRIRDGDWSIDVSLPPTVSYDDAEQVILALRRRTYIDVRQGRAGDITDIDLNRINRFGHDNRMAELFPDVYTKTFRIYADNYKWVGVRIRDGRVEFQGVSDWIP